MFLFVTRVCERDSTLASKHHSQATRLTWNEPRLNAHRNNRAWNPRVQAMKQKEQVSQGGQKSVKRSERSNGLDTALYKNYLYLFRKTQSTSIKRVNEIGHNFDIPDRTICGSTKQQARLSNNLQTQPKCSLCNTGPTSLAGSINWQLGGTRFSRLCFGVFRV